MANKQQSKAYYDSHKEQHKKWMDAWWASHPGKKSEYRARLKLKAFQIVSGQEHPACVYCGCDDPRFLEVNHKNGGGAKEMWTNRMKKNPNGWPITKTGFNLYNEIVKGRRKVDDLEIACRPDNALHFLRLKYGDAANRFEIIWHKEIDPIDSPR